MKILLTFSVATIPDQAPSISQIMKQLWAIIGKLTFPDMAKALEMFHQSWVQNFKVDIPWGLEDICTLQLTIGWAQLLQGRITVLFF